MKYLLIIFLSLYFKEFYALLTLNSEISINPDFLTWAISHYEGWIIVISFIIVLAYIQAQYKTEITESSNVVIFNLLNTLVLKKLLLRKRYLDQLYFIQFANILFTKFQLELGINLSILSKIVSNEINYTMLRKLQFFNIYTSRNYMDRVYLI